MSDRDNAAPMDNSKKSRIGKGVGYIVLALFGMVLLAAVLQATLDTPKKGEDGEPAPREDAAQSR